MPSIGLLGSTHFHVPLHENFIDKHGTQAFVLPVLQCPCLMPDRQFSPVCPSCHGTGRFYPPGQGYSVMLLLQHEDSHRTYPQAGTWTEGSILATVKVSGQRLCERDKVVVLDLLDEFNDEILTKGIDEEVRFGSSVHLLTVADRARVYRLGTDYVLAPPRTVSWVAGGQSPDFGSQFSVKYEANPEFLVVNDSPRLRVEYRVMQVQEVVLLRLDKVSDDF